MPTLSRFIMVLIALGLAAFGAVYALATFVEPTPREITIRIPTDKLLKD
ncbi:hypothetical protein LB518_13885 [Mesorhizobium sp. BR1-1-16]|nr:hypothetical protein [Mesorhizobium sp. BR1-1-16]MBZ9937391.1 hypothetical protein [Mesorhizobium sp. BR1-1-16]